MVSIFIVSRHRLELMSREIVNHFTNLSVKKRVGLVKSKSFTKGVIKITFSGSSTGNNVHRFLILNTIIANFKSILILEKGNEFLRYI